MRALLTRKSGVPAGHYSRFGIVGDGATDDTAALARALEAGYADDLAIDLGAGLVIVTDPFTMNAASLNVPPAITGRGVTIRAGAGAAGVLVTLENPHGAKPDFQWDGVVFDAAGLCSSAFLLHGSQRCRYGAMRFIGAVGGPQCRVEAEANFGVYYNVYEHWIAGGLTADGGDDDGFSIKSTDGSNRMNANTWVAPKSSWNVGHGYDIDRCSDVFLGPEAEVNDGEGFNVDNTTSLTILGGYSEHNNEGMSGGGASDATPDRSLVLTANSNRVVYLGGRHIGAVVGDDLGAGHLIFPGASGGVMLRQGGMGFGGASAVANGLGFLNTADWLLRMSGSTKLSWEQATDRMRSRVEHLMLSAIIGAGTPAKDAAALLELVSTTQGLLLPRMTTTQQNNIAAPPDGLVIYNTTTSKLMVRAAGAWVATH